MSSRNRVKNSGYYGMQSKFYMLFKMAKRRNTAFYDLYPEIINPNNILLSYRMIKNNKGSRTPGVNGHTIAYLKNKNVSWMLHYVRKRLANYTPSKVRCFMIAKKDGGIRRIGITTIEEKLLAQCIKQILEPICEAQFYPHSYGYRPGKSTISALDRVNQVIKQGYKYVVTIDIKKFFDNIEHEEVLYALWKMKIRDRRVLEIIWKMMKAEIVKEGSSSKGIIQGSVLSPLLANVVLNQFDWWFDRQERQQKCKKAAHLVRYCDDITILCETHDMAIRMYWRVEAWLYQELGLELKPVEKIVYNVMYSPVELLGFQVKAKKYHGKIAIQGSVKQSSKAKIATKMKGRLKHIKCQQTVQAIENYNALVRGTQDYYKMLSLALMGCTRDSIANSLLSMVIQGLDPSKNQCYFIVYGNQLVLQRSYFGSMAVAKRLDRFIQDIYGEVIYWTV